MIDCDRIFIGKIIQNRRKALNLSQEDLAIKMNNHREFISRIERGLVDVRYSTLKNIANALNVRVIELLCEEIMIEK